MAEPVNFSAPRGMRDFYPEDMVLRNTIFQAWATAARRFGFEQYDSCVVESLGLLKRKGGEEIQDQIYWFKDKSDRELAPLLSVVTPVLSVQGIAGNFRDGVSHRFRRRCRRRRPEPPASLERIRLAATGGTDRPDVELGR